MHLITILLLLTTLNVVAEIDSEEFKVTYFGHEQFLNAFANELTTKPKLCLFNCIEIATSLGFYHTDKSIKYGRVTKPYNVLSHDIIDHPFLQKFYGAVNLALIDAKLEADPYVHVELIGIFYLTEVGNVSFIDWQHRDNLKHNT